MTFELFVVSSWFLVGGIGFQPVMRCHALTDRLEAYPTLYPVTTDRLEAYPTLYPVTTDRLEAYPTLYPVTGQR